MLIQTTLAVVAFAALAGAQIPCWETNLGTDLGASHNTYSAAQPLGFAFPFNGTSYTDIVVCSNGYLWLGASAPAGVAPDSTPSVAELTGQAGARIAPLWNDWYFSVTGSVYFQSLPAAGATPARAIVTWDRVHEAGPYNPCSFQITLAADGSITIHYDTNCGMISFSTVKLIGASQGNGAPLHAVDFGSLPLFRSGSPTLHQTLTYGFPFAGLDMQWLPDATTGYQITARTQCSPAAFRSFGHGCPQQAIIYEQFDAGACDLGNQTLAFIRNGLGGYVVAFVATPMLDPTRPGSAAVNLLVGDDSVSAPQTLPFPFPFAASSTNVIGVASNGFLWLDGVTTLTHPGGVTPQQFAYFPASIAAFCEGLAPGSSPAGGGIYYEADAQNGVVYVTWWNIPDASDPASLNTFQLALYSTGNFEIVFGAVSNVTQNPVTGFSVGNSSTFPASVDFTASTPFDTGMAGQPLLLGTTAGRRPTLGSTFPLRLDNFPANTVVGVMVLGFGHYRLGIDLSLLGMAGCSQYASLDSANLMLVTPPTATFQLSIPNSPWLTGLEVFAQGVAVAAGFNTLGLITSNGGAVSIGN